jgi:hypothetical protein
MKSKEKDISPFTLQRNLKNLIIVSLLLQLLATMDDSGGGFSILTITERSVLCSISNIMDTLLVIRLSISPMILRTNEDEPEELKWNQSKPLCSIRASSTHTGTGDRHGK